MSYFDTSIPADTEGVKLGASRIRDMKSAMNTLISQIWNDSGAFLSGWVTSALISTSTLIDASRAISAYAIQTGSITLRALKSGTLFFANSLSQSYFDNQCWPTSKLSADIFLTTSGTFVQPAVGFPVTVATTTDPVAAGILSGGPSGVEFTSAATFNQPIVGSTVIVTVASDPVAAGVIVGARVKAIDGSFVNDYLVTAVLTSPMQVTLQLVNLNGPSIATTVLPVGMNFFTASRTVTIPDGAGVDTYVISAATTTPNVTLTLVSIGGTNTAGTTIASGTIITSLGAVLSADVAGRARMGAGFFAPGTTAFQPASIQPSFISVAAGVLPDGFVKAKIELDSSAAARLVTVSTTVDSINNYINTSSAHGLTDATSLATVQPVVFLNVSQTSPDTGSNGPLSTATVYFVRVIGSTTLAVYTTAAAAWAATGRIVFSSNLGAAGWTLAYLNLSHVGTTLNAYVTPLGFYPDIQSGGSHSNNAAWCGYRVFFQTPFSSASSYSASIGVQSSNTQTLYGRYGKNLSAASLSYNGASGFGLIVSTSSGNAGPTNPTLGFVLATSTAAYVDIVFLGRVTSGSASGQAAATGDSVPFAALDNAALPTSSTALALTVV